jgi:DNA (cytosine-5)-methyltransferase 1
MSIQHAIPAHVYGGDLDEGRQVVSESLQVRVADFFSGCGGTSAGLRAAGMNIILGLDIDPDSAATYKANFPEAAFRLADIGTVDPRELEEYLQPGGPLLFSGCAPCQPFSKQAGRRRKDSGRAFLLDEFARMVRYFLPDLVFVENVPGLQQVAEPEGPFTRFIAMLGELDYSCCHGLVFSQDYGVPQRRRRLVLIASRLGPIRFPTPTHGPGRSNSEFSNVWEWIGHLPPLAAGEKHPEVPNHETWGLTPLNLERIRATPMGGGRSDWPEHLVLECHGSGHRGHSDVYGRMHKYQPASALTTRCVSLSNGRFGHPEQDRAISVREAACLQTFPLDFTFSGPMTSAARQVGNAVPVRLAQRFGEAFLGHVFERWNPGTDVPIPD